MNVSLTTQTDANSAYQAANVPYIDMRPSVAPLITIAVPSFNQGKFLDEALQSIFSQQVPIEVFVADGGSTDNSLDVIQKWAPRLAGWRSHADNGQAAAINEAIARGTAPYVCWLNSDDLFLPDGLSLLIDDLQQKKHCPAAYGRAWHLNQATQKRHRAWVEPFKRSRLAVRCFVTQPASLIRRSAWEQLGGLDETMTMALDYDLWWRLSNTFGPLSFVDRDIAVNRNHDSTKTRIHRRKHYVEAMSVVKRHYGRVPLKWWIAQPYAVWWKTLIR